MSRFRILTIATLTLGFLLLPALFLTSTGSNGQPFCSLSSASAQDNPCLVQDATNTALQLEVVNLKGTITALEAAVAASGGGSVTQETPGLPFIEDFTDNQSGWSLLPGISLSQGSLSVARSPNRYAIVPIEAGSNFYMEFNGTSEQGLEIVIGDTNEHGEGHYHMFSFYKSGDISVGEVQNNTNYLIATTHVLDALTGRIPGEFNRIGISYQNGEVEVYVNGKSVIITQFMKLGNKIGIGAGGGIASYDNLEIRASR